MPRSKKLTIRTLRGIERKRIVKETPIKRRKRLDRTKASMRATRSSTADTDRTDRLFGAQQQQHLRPEPRVSSSVREEHLLTDKITTKTERKMKTLKILYTEKKNIMNNGNNVTKPKRLLQNRHERKIKLALQFENESIVAISNVGKLDNICKFCSALHFNGEQRRGLFNNCCHKGKVQLPPVCVPDFLRTLITSNNHVTKNYQENIRNFNSALAFASVGAKLAPPPGMGPYCFRIHGAMHHYYGSLHPADESDYKFNSLYILDSEQALKERMKHPENSKCDTLTMKHLQLLLSRVSQLNDSCQRCLTLENLIFQVSPYAHLYMHMLKLEDEEKQAAAATSREIRAVSMFLLHDTSKDPRRYNHPNTGEIAAIFLTEDGEPPAEKDIVVYSHNRHPSIISVLSPHSDPLCYPLLYPCGEAGWRPGMPLNHSRTVPATSGQRSFVSQLQFYSYRIATREGFSLLHSSGKLFQKYVVDAYVKREGNRLNYIRLNQTQLRVETYQGLYDYVTKLALDASLRLGRMIILPSSFTGSPRNMAQNYQDAMAIVRKFGKPDLFITFTCNPHWAEIKDNLEPYQRAEHRPDLVARVYKLKLDELLHDLTKRHIFGVVIAYIYVVEFQKRGLPHAHILLILDAASKIRDVTEIDTAVCAEIPDSNSNPILYNIIKSNMVHGPCGPLNPKSPCMESGECTKNFPKEFCAQTKVNDNGYPDYRRRENGVTISTGKVSVDNRWIVPYNPFLSIKYNAHINVEITSSVKSVKYLYKYVYKGYDCSSVQLRQEFQETVNGKLEWNEINTYLDTRYVSAPEAMWRLSENDMQRQSHGIIRLAVHLPLNQSVVFADGQEAEALARAVDADTTLTAWFKLNANDINAHCVHYHELPEQYVWNTAKDKKAWTRRKTRGHLVIGRMYNVSPVERERYFLRLLLLNVKGATSFEYLRTVNGVLCHTFQEAAKQLHLLDDNTELEDCMKEASSFQMPCQLRDMFAYICVFCLPVDVEALWLKFRENLAEDYRRYESEEGSFNRALWDISEVLHVHGMNCEGFGLPRPTCPPNQGGSLYDAMEETAKGNTLLDKMNEQQSLITRNILDAVNDIHSTRLYFVDGPGGTGKTYIYRCLLHLLRARGLTVIPVAWTGIAANLLSGGRTTHSVFKFPINLNENSVSLMKPNSMDADRLRAASLIVWDEAPMAPKAALKTLDRLLREICQNDQLFGGKLIVLGGDFRQVLPVIRHGAKTAAIEACLQRSSLWSQIKKFRLVVNMRAGPGEKEFSEWLLKLGEGKLKIETTMSDCAIELPPECVFQGGLPDLVSYVYGTTINMKTILERPNRAILCPKNEDCDYINDYIIDSIPGEAKCYFSVDSLDSDDPEDTNNYPPEFLNSLTPSGLPPHKLRLKSGAVIMLIRNLNGKKGLVNGTRMVVHRVYDNSLDAEVIVGECQGRRVLIPRIELAPSDPSMPFTIRRRQFPVRLAFAMTINKSQGQTLDRLGIFLPRPVFAHGQLYVAFSRVSSMANVRVKVINGATQGTLKGRSGTFTSNVVYNEILN